MLKSAVLKEIQYLLYVNIYVISVLEWNYNWFGYLSEIAVGNTSLVQFGSPLFSFRSKETHY